MRRSLRGTHGVPLLRPKKDAEMPKYIAAIDQGTTSTRCILFNQSGSPVSADQREHDQIFPQPGWVEHDPLQIWARVQAVVQGALQRAGVGPDALAAIGITNQRETTIVWNRKTGQPYHNAIVWQDTRTDKICTALALEGGQDRFRERVGLPLHTYFSGPKLCWLLDNVPGLPDAAARGEALFGNVDCWLIWNLTGGPEGGVHVTDVTNASRTLLMNLRSLDWDDECLAALGIPRTMLPEIRPSSDPAFYGRALGGVPVCGDLGDQQAALVGQTCFLPGEAKNTYGTGCFTLLNTGTEPIQSRSGLLTTVGYRFDNQPAVYALEGSVAMTGALVQWLRDNLDLFDFSHQIEDYARQVPDNGGVYFVPAFSGLFAPYWQADARGVIVGLTRFANKNHLCRAALEATAYQTREVLEAMARDSGVRLTALKADGGMVYNQTLMQFQADILNVPVVRPVVSETTALGAAYAAGLAVGFWGNLDDLRANWQVDRTWQPVMSEAERDRLYQDWLRAVQRSMHWVET
jgi:glycerol kinase